MKDFEEIVIGAEKVIDKHEKSNKELRSNGLKSNEIIKERDLELKKMREELEQKEIEDKSNKDDYAQCKEIAEMIQGHELEIKRLRDKSRVLIERVSILEC